MNLLMTPLEKSDSCLIQSRSNSAEGCYGWALLVIVQTQNCITDFSALGESGSYFMQNIFASFPSAQFQLSDLLFLGRQISLA